MVCIECVTGIGEAKVSGVGSKGDWIERASSAIHRNNRAFNRVVDHVAKLVAQGKLEDAAAYGQIAADLAWRRHPGLYVSDELEELLMRIGRMVAAPDKSGGPKLPIPTASQVLHVLSQAYVVGGHTRLCWRWIENDSTRMHSVALTNQATITPPRKLTDAVAESGGRCYYLDRNSSSLIERAARLNEIGRNVDFVVLHVHPNDALPLLAFADPDGLPPIILVNHADHVFWLGKAISNLVVSIRESGEQLATKKRGVPAEMSAILPIPLTSSARTSNRSKAKQKLGLSPDVTLLLSIASGTKYLSVDTPDFIDLHEPFVSAHPNVALWVVGPGSEGKWQVAGQSSQGRIRALGRQNDLSLYHQAADIYVDSFPFSSLTSLLEAVTYGMPAISFNPYGKDAAIMRLDSPGLEHLPTVYESTEGYLEALRNLVDNEPHRLSLGREMSQSVYSAHIGEVWDEELQAIYGRAFTHAESRVAFAGRTPLNDTTMSDYLLTRMQHQTGLSERVHALVSNHPQLLRLRARVRRLVARSHY